MRTIVDAPGTLYLGKQGEHLARELAFPEPAAWAEEFGAGAAQLLVRPCGGKAYPVILSEEDGFAVWRITAADTARAGYGRCELRWSVYDRAMTASSGHARLDPARPLDGAVAGSWMVMKSKTYVTYVAEGLSGGCGCHDNWGAYLEQIAQAGADALNAASRAEDAARRAEDAARRAEAAGSGSVPDAEIATDEEVAEMLEEVFGAAEGKPDGIATDEEINEMLDEIFGSRE